MKTSVEVNLIKSVVLFVSTYYCNFKILNRKIKFDLKTNILIIIMGILSGVIKYKTNGLIGMIILVISVSIIFSENNIGNTILTTIISLGINYGLNSVSIIICFLIEKVSGIRNDLFELVTIFIIYGILLLIFFRMHKFKYGLAFLQKNISNEYMDIVILNISVIILFLVMRVSVFSDEMTGIISFEIIIYSIIMYITIKKSLQLYYKQKLLVQELKETKEELESKNKELKELEKENLEFSKKSHTLIHKQKSLEYKIQQIAMKTEISEDTVAEVKEKLNNIGDEIYKEKEIIELSKTGIQEIDDMLKYMQSECNKNKIEFILKLQGNIFQMTNNAIPKEELEILLADHIKNAIIAINHTENANRAIMVRLGKSGATYELKIYDTGIEFELQTLQTLGKKPSTTHAEEGGTGMGFMNTFETLSKYKASMIIEEYGPPNIENYTKSINIIFDKNNKFEIKSYRQE